MAARGESATAANGENDMAVDSSGQRAERLGGFGREVHDVVRKDAGVCQLVRERFNSTEEMLQSTVQVVANVVERDERAQHGDVRMDVFGGAEVVARLPLRSQPSHQRVCLGHRHGDESVRHVEVLARRPEDPSARPTPRDEPLDDQIDGDG
jgi:hypothetical protein